MGITSIGNARNPSLPFGGASIIASAGVGGADGSASNLDFSNFISQFLDPTNAASFSSRYLPDLGGLLGLPNATNDQVWTAFEQLSKQDQGRLALDIFYLVPEMLAVTIMTLRVPPSENTRMVTRRLPRFFQLRQLTAAISH